MRMLILALIVAAALPAAAEQIVESGSKTEFPASAELVAADGERTPLRAVGTGLRKKMIFKVYAACFYVDELAELGDGEEAAAEAAIHGRFAKRITMHFLRDVGADKIRGAFEDGIRKTLPEGSDDAVADFLGLFQDKVMKGDQLVLDELPGGGVVAHQADARLGMLTDQAVIAALWATWFGEDPISDDLKRGLLGQ